MSKTLIAVALAAFISAPALAQDAPTSKLPGSLAVVSETERSIENKTTVTEFGLAWENKGLSLGLLPTYNWDNKEISNIEYSAAYTINLNDKLAIEPYGQYHTNKDFEESDKIVGIRTKLTLF